MGILNGVLGNASQIDVEEVKKEYGQIFFDVDYKIIRNTFIFTNKRLILIDVQRFTDKKVEYHSYPYDKVTHFAIETSGNFDLDAELKIWISGMETPVSKQFNKNTNIYEVQSVLAENILNK